MSIDIGGRLRYVRMRQNLSQRELAKRAGVTNSTVSLIEANQSNPSVGALKRILDGFPSAWQSFSRSNRMRRTRYSIRPRVEIGKGSISYRQVGITCFRARYRC